MNKGLLMVLAATAMLTSCSEEHVVDSDINKAGNAIGFSTYKNVTRGNPVDNNGEFMTNGYAFGVTAFISGTPTSPYMGTDEQGVKIVSTSSKWGYQNANEQAFWPTDTETLDFYAYAPYENTGITNLRFSKTTPFLSFNYTVAATEGEQVDLMFASATGAKKPSDENSVMLPFKHALTQVHFAIGTKADRLKIDVAEDGISIHNIKGTGTFNLPTQDTDNGWTDLSTPTTYTVTSKAVLGIGYIGNSNPSYTPVGTEDNALMLLPQQFNATTTTPPTDSGSYLAIKCKIYQVLADNTPIYLKGDTTSYATVYVPISSKGMVKNTSAEVWNRAKKVTYNLLIGGGTILNPIEFTTTVEDWLPADGGIIENQ